MKININLASQKYEDARAFYVRWGGALALVTVITAVLAVQVWSSYRTMIRETRHIRELRGKIERLDKEQQQAEAVLNRPENQDVRDQSQFWNDVIDRKSLSWTELFSDLEKIMPARAYVVSVQPKVTTDRRLQLRLVLVGEKFEDANDLLTKMEHSERFRLPELAATSVMKPEAGVGARTSTAYQFEILTYYTPAVPPSRTQVTAAKKGA
jgi:Tfp pilus assembly protein PilN